MYKVMLKKTAMRMDEYSEVIEFEDEWKARSAYHSYMNKPYYFGRLARMVNGKEESMSSFCNSRYIKEVAE